MAVKLRLKRWVPRRLQDIVSLPADSRFARDGREIETIGHINPTTEPETVVS